MSSEMNKPQLAEKIKKAKHAGLAKQLSKDIASDEERLQWEMENHDVMKYLIRQKFEQCEEFRAWLSENKGKTLAEATGSRLWVTGMSPFLSQNTAPDYWPGKNLLGAILTELANELPDEPMDENRESSSENEHENEHVKHKDEDDEDDNEDDEDDNDEYEDAHQESMEQMMIFIQYFDFQSGEVECKFLSSKNLFANADRPNASTLCAAVKEELLERQIPLKCLKGLSTDGAAVMTGVKNGWGALLKEDVPQLISVYCICLRLALSCVDTCKDLHKIKQIKIECYWQQCGKRLHTGIYVCWWIKTDEMSIFNSCSMS